jgi:hypothetical protein
MDETANSSCRGIGRHLRRLSPDVRTKPDPTPTPSLVKRTLQTVLLVLVAAAGALLLAGPAAAKEPCWKTLIDDWYDGRIDNVYPVPCYRAALEHMPEDVAQYSTLGDDINRALQAAIAAQNSGGGSPPPASGGVKGETSPNSSTDTSTFYGGPTAEREGAVLASDGRDPGGGAVGQTLDALGPGDADSVPVPLLVLAGLSILLLTLGAAGFVARRVQTRRATGGPRTDA